MGDLISREKTLYRLATSAVYYFDLEEDKAAHGWAMHIVSGMPDEEPERKTGQWIPKDDGRYHCSSCNGIAPKGYRWDFCPNCGADMRGEKE